MVEGATGDEGHQLHAEADPEDGLGSVMIVEFAEKRGFECLAFGADEVGLGMGGDAEGLGGGVVASGEDKGIEPGRGREGQVGDRGDEYGMPPRCCDSLGVVSGADGGRAGVSIDEIGGNRHERAGWRMRGHAVSMSDRRGAQRERDTDSA